MKKTFYFKYEEEGKKYKDSILDAIKSGENQDRPNEVICHSIEGLYKLATANRMNIINTVINKNPTSIYDLAKIMNKDQAYVTREISILIEIGVISLQEETLNGRKVKRPISPYDRVEIICKITKDRSKKKKEGVIHYQEA